MIISVGRVWLGFAGRKEWTLLPDNKENHSGLGRSQTTEAYTQPLCCEKCTRKVRCFDAGYR